MESGSDGLVGSGNKDKKTDDVYNFILEYNSLRKQLEEKIDKFIASGDKLTLQADLDELVAEYDKLKKYLGHATLYLPSYNLKIAQESLRETWDKVESKRSELLPKAKFSFKRNLVSNTERTVDTVDFKAKPDITMSLSTLTEIRDVENCDNLLLSQDDVDGKCVQLVNLNGCTVNVEGSPVTCHIKNLTDCKIFFGPVTTSVFIDDCKRCTFQLACQQLRIHTSHCCDLYLHVTSRAICENCTDLRFGLYSHTYSGIAEDYAKSGLDVKVNNWNQIDDFDWLSSDKPSPNWSLLN